MTWLDDSSGAKGIADAVALRWSCHPRCVGLARAELRRALRGWGLSCLEDAAVLVLSEILTDFVRHAHVLPGREIETRYLRSVQGLRIEVYGATDQPRQPTNDASAPQHDFGLKLLQALPDRRGTEPRSGPRMVVWAELNVPSRTGAGNVI
ncbi:ATP-binding protein [Streptomyces phyllanthi]|uniref:ATP-binding protein n=1 Tax=Streptomyces phyllanthi TaxID=1803180 RepID=A0A5N8W4Y2_9ACTN|nr:ATP-binding protein [Streptomyces phyllanthi]MPY42543.1 ATP-binding protein [Streptomyces phyllanthi]